MAFRTGSAAVDMAAVDTRYVLGINLGRSRANAAEHCMESERGVWWWQRLRCAQAQSN